MSRNHGSLVGLAEWWTEQTQVATVLFDERARGINCLISRGS
jgi:hypothetical protein